MFHREVNGVSKTVPNARAKAWPMQGGLQTITNTTTVRNQVAPTRGYEQVAANQSAVEGIPEAAKANTLMKTPSPNKVTIKVEPASGKENAASTA